MTKTEMTIQHIEMQREVWSLGEGNEMIAYNVTRNYVNVTRGGSRPHKHATVALSFAHNDSGTVCDIHPKRWAEIKTGMEAAGYTFIEK